jgi:hypothetical protein
VRVETERSDGDRGMILFDGKGITAFKADEHVYARVEKSGTVDDAVVYQSGTVIYIVGPSPGP